MYILFFRAEPTTRKVAITTAFFLKLTLATITLAVVAYQIVSK